MDTYKITAETTDDELTAWYEGLKLALAERIVEGKGMDATTLAKEVNDIAASEGRLFAQHEYRNALANDADEAAIRRHLIRFLLNSPDDEWSGRSNDVRRAKHDGMRTQIASILEYLDRKPRS